MHYIGVDIGGMTIKVGLIDENGAILCKSAFETRVGDSPESVIDQLAVCIQRIIHSMKVHPDLLGGIGLGIPGSILNGEVLHSNNLHWDHIPIVDILSKKLSFDADKIFAENDANVAVLGEVYFGCCRDRQHAVLITLGTGIGTGIISNGQLLVGNGACGAEGGHMVIVPNGNPCTCGRKGCWEAYASATALERMTREAIEHYPDSGLANESLKEGKVSGKTAFNAYRAGDKVARRVVKQYIKNVGIGLVNLANILRPEVIAIGGGISKEGEWFCRALQDMMDEEAYGGEANPRVIIKQAVLGNDAGIIGAGAFAMYSSN